MMMPANFSAVAENELTYVVGGASLVDYLAPAMTTQNWQNVSTNVVKIIGNTFLANYVNAAFNSVFDGAYVPGDFIGGVFNTVHMHTIWALTPLRTALGAQVWAS